MWPRRRRVLDDTDAVLIMTWLQRIDAKLERILRAIGAEDDDEV